MRVHVTGGSGFLGGRVVPLLVAAGHEVTALARSKAAADKLTDLGASPVDGDLDDAASIDDAFRRCGAEALMNLASLGFGHGPAIVAAAEEARMTRAVFVSSTSIFTDLAPASKPVRVAAEEAIRTSALAWTIVRPTMIYGAPGDRNMARLVRALRRLPVLPLPGGGRALQQPVHVDDLAAALVTVLERPETARREYNLAGPDALTLRALVGEAAAAAGRRPVLIPVPLTPVVALMRAYERASPAPRLRSEQIARLAEDKAVDIEPARRDLDFRPRSFANGIRREAEVVG